MTQLPTDAVCANCKYQITRPWDQDRGKCASLKSLFYNKPVPLDGTCPRFLRRVSVSAANVSQNGQNVRRSGENVTRAAGFVSSKGGAA